MPDTSTMKSKDKSSKQRFGHVNSTNPIFFKIGYHFHLISYTISEKPKKLFVKKNKKPRLLEPTSTALVAIQIITKTQKFQII